MGLVDTRIEHIFHRPWKWLSVPKSWDKGREVRSLAFLLFQHTPSAATQSYLLNSTKMRKYQMHWRFFLYPLVLLFTLCSLLSFPLLPFLPLFALFPFTRHCWGPIMFQEPWVYTNESDSLCYSKAYSPVGKKKNNPV